MLAFWWAFALEFLFKSTAVLVIAWGASLLLRRVSAAVRHMVWVTALCSLLLLPTLMAFLPAWRTSVFPRNAVSVSEVRVVASANQTTAPRTPAPRGLPERLALPVLALWIAGSLFFLRRWRSGMEQVSRLRRRAAPVTQDPLSEMVCELSRQLGLRRPAMLLVSDRDIVPMTAGVRQPVVLLPTSASHWSRERLRVVLLHEMAHIRRKDCITQALAELVASLYWFNPLVWIAVRRLRMERERACDDLVLSAGSRASDYAAHLLELAKSLGMRDPSPSIISMASASNLETRLGAILNPHLSRRASTPLTGAMAFLVAACLVLPLAAMRPQTGDTRLFSGTVYDPSGAVVPDAAVILTNSDNGLKRTTATDQAGRFSIGPLADGKYRLEVDARGFAAKFRQFRFDGTHELHFDIIVDLGWVEENLVVRGKGSPAPPPAGPRRVRVGGNAVPAKLVYQVKPEYPEELRSRGIVGDVILHAVISKEGTVLSPTSVSSPDPQLTEAAIFAVRQWRYQPSLLNGEPVETTTTITLNFQLEP